ncbi:MAG: hypothetical protein M1830_004885 [Pleopsidium flavum]|nr:MAG: hypothetical protein M1830_004885 [Pleopsidium flavum]
MATLLGAPPIPPALTPYTSATQVIAFLQKLQAQKTTSELSLMYGWKVVAQNQVGLDAEFGSESKPLLSLPLTPRRQFEQPSNVQSRQARFPSLWSGCTGLPSRRKLVSHGRKRNSGSSKRSLACVQGLLQGEADFARPAQRIGHYTAPTNLRLALKNRLGGAREVETIWIRGGGNANQSNCRPMLQL